MKVLNPKTKDKYKLQLFSQMLFVYQIKKMDKIVRENPTEYSSTADFIRKAITAEFKRRTSGVAMMKARYRRNPPRHLDESFQKLTGQANNEDSI